MSSQSWNVENYLIFKIWTSKATTLENLFYTKSFLKIILITHLHEIEIYFARRRRQKLTQTTENIYFL